MPTPITPATFTPEETEATREHLVRIYEAALADHQANPILRSLHSTPREQLLFVDKPIVEFYLSIMDSILKKLRDKRLSTCRLWENNGSNIQLMVADDSLPPTRRRHQLAPLSVPSLEEFSAAVAVFDINTQPYSERFYKALEKTANRHLLLDPFLPSLTINGPAQSAHCVPPALPSINPR